MWYTSGRWIRVLNLRLISLKMTFGVPFECRKRPLFTSFLRIPTIFWFLIFLRFWWGKNVLGSFFAFLTKNWPKNMYYSVRWPKSAVWSFLTSWHEKTLTWPIGYKALEWSFEVSGTQFMPICWPLIRFWSLFLMAISLPGNDHQFSLWPDLWRHRWLQVNKICFLSTNCPGLSNAVWIFKIVPVVSEIRGGKN